MQGGEEEGEGGVGGWADLGCLLGVVGFSDGKKEGGEGEGRAP